MNDLDFQKELEEIYKNDDGCLFIPRKIIIKTKSPKTAFILGNLIELWVNHKDKDNWVYRTYDDWEKEVFLSKQVVRRCLKKLKELKIIQTKVKKVNGLNTLHYKLSIKNLKKWVI